MLSKIISYFKKRKTSLIFLFFIVFIAGLNYTFAKDDNNSAEVINGFYIILSTFLGLFTELAGVFLSPSWTSGSVFGLDDYLKKLWILVSNVVYFIFAFLLIFIAFMNIIGSGKENYQLKQALPKFVIGVLIVPFSWFFVQFVVSASSVLTASVISLPFDSFVTNDDSLKEKLNSFKICKDVSIKGTENKEGTENKDDKFYFTNTCEGEKIGLYDAFEDTSSTFSVMRRYTYGIFNIDEQNKIEAEDLKDITTFLDIIIKIGFDGLLVIIYSILVIAIVMALFVRGIWLWLYIVFSPAFGLLYFFGKDKEGFMDGKFSLSEFINLALVPVYVGGALAFGFLFLLIVSSGISDKASENGDNTLSISSEGPGSTVETAGGFKFTYIGPVGTSSSSEISEFAGKIGSGLGSIIIKLFGIAVLWMAVMAALKSSKITGEIISPIENFGKQIGGLVMKAPQYIPMIPTGDGAMSIEGLSSAGSQISQGIRSASQSSGNDFADKVKRNLGLQGDKIIDSIQKRISNGGDFSTYTQNQKVDFVNKIFRDDVGKFEDIRENKMRKEKLEEALEKVGIKVDIKNTTRLEEIAKELHEKAKDQNIHTILGWNTSEDVEDYLKGLNGTGGSGSNQNTTAQQTTPTEAASVYGNNGNVNGLSNGQKLGVKTSKEEVTLAINNSKAYKIKLSEEVSKVESIDDLEEVDYKLLKDLFSNAPNISTDDDKKKVLEAIFKKIKDDQNGTTNGKTKAQKINELLTDIELA